MIWLPIIPTNENDWRGCNMKTYQEIVEGLEQYQNTDDVFEAGNISSGLAIKKHHNCINYGRQIVKSRTSTDSEKLLARMLVEVASLSLMAVAVSGEKSFLSTVAKGATLRKI